MKQYLIYISLCIGSVLSTQGNGTRPIDSALANNAMQRGMNFGNVFDYADEVTSWGAPAPWVSLTPATLERMADLYYQKGFKSFRIPFTWSTIIDTSSDSGAFDDSHLKFTKYIGLIDYILNKYPDAYVIVNTHHDRWYEEAPWPARKTLFENLWVNIANYFEPYSFRLILEIDNEPFHGVSNGTATHANTISIMKTGWDAIRGTGGNNVNRILMIAPLGGHEYNLNGTYGSLDNINQVTGGDNDHVIITLHDYSPWFFCGNVEYEAETKGEDTPVDYANKQERMAGYAQWSQTMGIPVNIGEFGIAWRYAARYADGNLPPEPTAKQVDWFRTQVSLMEANDFSYNVWDDNGWFKVLDRENLLFNSLIGFADTTILVGGAVRNGDFNAAPAGDEVSFADTPFWQNIKSSSQEVIATRTNMKYDGTPAAYTIHDTGHAVDTGHTIANGDVFDLSYVWRDAYHWNDAHDQIVVSLYVTDDNTLTGTRTNLVSDFSGLSTIDETFETVDRPAFYMADAEHVGKRLFLAIEPDYEDDGQPYSRVDNVVLKLQRSLSTWKAFNFTEAELQNSTISGNSADPDGDHRQNLLEFIQKTSPVSADAAEKSQALSTTHLGGEVITLRFVESKQLDLLGIFREFKGSPDLSDFSKIHPLSIEVINEDASTQTLEAQLPASGQHYFYTINYFRQSE
jgi:hypothetical protein